MDLTSKRILVTGGAGFLGRHLVARLRRSGCQQLFIPRSTQFDLTCQADIHRLFREVRPEVVFHLAGVVAGIGGNRRHPGTLAYKNVVMGAQLIEAARLSGVEKFLLTGTVCSYPHDTPVPFRESDLWSGFPEESNAPYGLAKKMLLVQLQAYRQEFGFQGVNLLLVNLYGSGDNFDLDTSHVIPALIRKCIEARDRGEPTVEVWGSGRATREFLHVADAARAIQLGMELLDTSDPVNIGSGQEIAIADLAALIAEKTGYHGQLVFDASKPDGQLRRCLDTTQARNWLGFEAEIDLERGLEETVAWYELARRELGAEEERSWELARQSWVGWEAEQEQTGEPQAH